jgi:CDP-diacylglycerol--glycerol-3-phosphate 3-phosphatidyltransferase
VFLNKLEDCINSLYQKSMNENSSAKIDECEKSNELAFIYPLLQIPDSKFILDEIVLKKVFECAPKNSRINLATGYFNLIPDFENCIISTSKANCDILVSSPEANGFFSADGLASKIPAMYSFYENSFFNQVNASNQQDRISIYEYKRNHWTYHAKGLWYFPENSRSPCLTIIGSSNFSYRSVNRDLEAQFVIFSKNTNLQKKLQRVSIHDNSLKKSFCICLEIIKISKTVKVCWVFE